MTKATILAVDDDPAVLQALEALLDDDYDVLTAASGEEAIELVGERDDVAAVLMDIKMPGIGGLEAARAIRELSADTSMLFHTGYPGDYDEDDIDAAEMPFDYLIKGSGVPRLLRSLRNGVNAYNAKVNAQHIKELSAHDMGIVGRSEKMQNVIRLMRKVSPSKMTVMVYGESGTGKDLVARGIHALSPRRDMPFIAFNCNRSNSEVADVELFGYRKGAFTDAREDRVGLFEHANGGTMLLDEVADLSARAQGKLLEIVENGCYRPLGPDGPDPLKTDIRIICATNQDLKAKAVDGSFREDLFYRLDGLKIVLPPLRDRREDIPLLVRYFADALADRDEVLPKAFEQGAIDALVKRDWPGNVRSIYRLVESLHVLCDSDFISEGDVLSYFESAEHEKADPGQKTLAERIDEFRKAAIADALAETEGNKRAAARLLGLDHRNLQRWIGKYGL